MSPTDAPPTDAPPSPNVHIVDLITIPFDFALGPQDLLEIVTDGGPVVIDTKHFPIVSTATHPIDVEPDATVEVHVRRCSHGSVIVHSKESTGKQRVEADDEPTVESLAATIANALPELPHANKNVAAHELAETVMKSAPVAEKKPPSDPIRQLARKITDAIFNREPAKRLTENLIVDTINDQGELTVRMTRAAPIVINVVEWPLLAEEFMGLEALGCISVRIRQHAQDGRLLVYGENRRLDNKKESRFAGAWFERYYPFTASETEVFLGISDVVATLIGSNTDPLHGQMVGNLLGKLPAQRL